MTPRVRDEHLSFTRQLRRDATTAETMLWRSLRGRDVEAKFRRQVPIGPYVADFACRLAKLIVELDGAPHDAPDKKASDLDRDDWFVRHGWRVLRLPNDLILTDGNLALDRIKTELGDSPHPTLADARATFSRGAGEGSKPSSNGLEP